jgi:hypothetical protein
MAPWSHDTAGSRPVLADVGISAEIRCGPVQSDQPQQALDEPSCLAKWQAKQDL